MPRAICIYMGKLRYEPVENRPRLTENKLLIVVNNYSLVSGRVNWIT